MKLFGKKRRARLPKNERVHYSASSFSFAIGDVFPISDAEEAKLLMHEREGYVVLLMPNDDLFENPHLWAKALSLSSYVIMFGDKNDKEIKSFMRILDSVIFSPVPKLISGSYCTNNKEEAMQILESMPMGDKCITIIPGEEKE